MRLPALRLVIASLVVVPQASAQTMAPAPDPALVEIRASDIGVDPGDSGRTTGGRLLFGLARFHAGDDASWADATFDDAGWEIASVGLRSDIFPQQGWPGVGWFRIRLRVHPSLQDRDLAFVIDHAGAIEVFFDGDRAYRSGTVGTSRSDEIPRVDRAPFVLPIRAGQEHVLALRYSSFGTEGFRAGWSFTGPGVYWGERATMLRHRELVRFNQGIFSAFFAAFALLFALLYGLYRTERLFLLLAVSYAVVVPFVFIGGQIPFVKNPQWVMPLLDAFFALGIAALLIELRIVYAFFYSVRPRPFVAFFILGLLVAAAVWFRVELVVLFVLFHILISLEMLRVIVVALMRRRPWAWIVAVGVVPGIGIQFWNELEIFGLVATPWSGSPFDPATVGMVFFAGAFTAYVGTRFAEGGRGLAEIEAARRVQLSMLPATVPQHPRALLAASMLTASRVGGDYYDFHLADDGALTIAVGDATGHGTEAGIMVTATKSLWSAFCTDADVTQILRSCHTALRRVGLRKLFMALAIARIRENRLDLVGTGLPPALLFRASTGLVTSLPIKGIPLGGPGRNEYRKHSIELSQGDTLILMTDGFPERFNRKGEILGYDQAISEFAKWADQAPADIVRQLTARSDEWADGRDLDDDQTFVVLQMKDGTQRAG